MQGLELGGQGEGRARVLKPGAPWPSPLQPSLHPDCFCSWSLQVGGGTWSPPPPPERPCSGSSRLCLQTAPLGAWKARGRPFQRLIIPWLM